MSWNNYHLSKPRFKRSSQAGNKCHTCLTEQQNLQRNDCMKRKRSLNSLEQMLIQFAGWRLLRHRRSWPLCEAGDDPQPECTKQSSTICSSRWLLCTHDNGKARSYVRFTKYVLYYLVKIVLVGVQVKLALTKVGKLGIKAIQLVHAQHSPARKIWHHSRYLNFYLEHY